MDIMNIRLQMLRLIPIRQSQFHGWIRMIQTLLQISIRLERKVEQFKQILWMQLLLLWMQKMQPKLI